MIRAVVTAGIGSAVCVTFWSGGNAECGVWKMRIG